MGLLCVASGKVRLLRKKISLKLKVEGSKLLWLDRGSEMAQVVQFVNVQSNDQQNKSKFIRFHFSSTLTVMILWPTPSTQLLLPRIL